MNEQTGFDPQRRLCPDGACTGIIGPDGRCGECGRAVGGPMNAGTPPAAFVTEGSPPMEMPRVPPPSTDGAGFDANRRLCNDGSCVGVLDEKGMCGVCGRVSG